MPALFTAWADGNSIRVGRRNAPPESLPAAVEACTTLIAGSTCGCGGFACGNRQSFSLPHNPSPASAASVSAVGARDLNWLANLQTEGRIGISLRRARSARLAWTLVRPGGPFRILSRAVEAIGRLKRLEPAIAG